jgi:hypothetical protein
LHHSGKGIVTDVSRGMALTRCIFDKQDTPWPKASHLTVAYSHLDLPDQTEEELSVGGCMPVAEPASRAREQGKLFGWSERRKVEGRGWRRETHRPKFHFLV